MNPRAMRIHSFIGVLLCMGLSSASDTSCETDPDDNLCDYNSSLKLRLTDSGHEISCGETLTKESTTDRPTVLYTGANRSDYYTLVMVDPDAPDPDKPTVRYWLHWIVTNIKGYDFIEGRLQGADEEVAYASPTPPIGTHRYQFYVMKQPSSSIDVVAPSGRGKFNVNQFIRLYNLCVTAAFQYKVPA